MRQRLRPGMASAALLLVFLAPAAAFAPDPTVMGEPAVAAAQAGAAPRWDPAARLAPRFWRPSHSDARPPAHRPRRLVFHPGGGGAQVRPADPKPPRLWVPPAQGERTLRPSGG